jgi:hypothetical protein
MAHFPHFLKQIYSNDRQKSALSYRSPNAFETEHALSRLSGQVSAPALSDQYRSVHSTLPEEFHAISDSNLRAIECASARGYDSDLIINNDDAEVRPGCVSALLAALAANPQAAACAPTIVHGAPHEQIVGGPASGSYPTGRWGCTTTSGTLWPRCP